MGVFCFFAKGEDGIKMKQKKQRQTLSIIGVVLMAIAVVAFVWYEWLGGRELLVYDDVVVLTKDVLQGETVTADKLAIVELEKDLITESTITDPNEIIGKSAKHFIPQSTTLHVNYFDKQELVLGEGEYISQIPVDWTISIPDTLRRGDEIIVYAATYENEILNNMQSNKSTSTSSSEDKEEQPSVVEEVGGAVEKVEEPKGELKELFTTNVAYVKDGSNKEVVTTSQLDRMDGSASISNVEIITTTNEFKMLEEQIKKGAKLIIMYSGENDSPVTTEETNE